MSAYDNNPTLPSTKVDSHVATTPANQTVTAAEINAMVTAINDLRLALQGGVPSEGGKANYFAFQKNTSPPAGAANQANVYTDGKRVLANANSDLTPRNMVFRHVNVLDYGADPTGVADSTSAFQSAINESVSSNFAGSGGAIGFWSQRAVYVPDGQYKITSKLTTLSAMFVMYSDHNAILQMGSGIDCIGDVTRNAVFVGITFSGGRNAITFSNGDTEGHTVISRCVFMQQTGAVLSGFYGSADILMKDCQVNDDISGGADNGQNIVNFTGCDVLEIDGGLWSTSKKYPFYIANTWLTLRGLRFVGVGGDGGAWCYVVSGQGTLFECDHTSFGGEGGGKPFVEWHQPISNGVTDTLEPNAVILKSSANYTTDYDAKFFNLPNLLIIEDSTGFTAGLGIHWDSSIPEWERAHAVAHGAYSLKNNVQPVTHSLDSDSQVVSIVDRESYLGTGEAAAADFVYCFLGNDAAFGATSGGAATNTPTTDALGAYADSVTGSGAQELFRNWPQFLQSQASGPYTLVCWVEVTGGPCAFQCYLGGQQKGRLLSEGRHVFSEFFYRSAPGGTYASHTDTHTYSTGDHIQVSNTIYRANNGGLSGTGTAPFAAAVQVGQTCVDGAVTWTCVGDFDVGWLATPSSGGTIQVNKLRLFKGRTAQGWQTKLFDSAAPVSGGPYQVGDLIINTVPAHLGNTGWVCTAAGTPGTWYSFGAIL
jgi:hypothetical protein